MNTSDIARRTTGRAGALLAAAALAVALVGCSSGGTSAGAEGSGSSPGSASASGSSGGPASSASSSGNSAGSAGGSASVSSGSASSVGSDSAVGSASAPTGGTVKIGLVAAWTGDAAFLGPALAKGEQVAIADINAAGGVNGAKVSMVKSDTGGTAQGATTAIDKVLKVDKVNGLVGPTSVTVMSVLSRIQASKVPTMVLGSTSALDDSVKGQTTFRVTPSDTLQGPAMAQLALDKGFKHCSIVTESLEGAQSVHDNVTKAYKALGGTIDQDIQLAVKQPSYSSEVLKLLNPAPTCVFIEISPETGAQFWQNASQFASISTPMFIGTDTLLNADTIKTLQPVKDKVHIVAVSPGSSGAGMQTYVDLYKKSFPKESTPVQLSDLSYDSTVILALAMQEAKSSDPATYVSHIRTVANDGTQCLSYSACKKLLDQGTDINFDGASGADDIQANGNSISGYDVFQIKNGEQSKTGTVSQDEVTALAKKLGL